MKRFPALSALLLILLVGCQSEPLPAYLNPSISEAYTRAYSLSASQPSQALAALQEAEKLDPDNGYTLYLRASLQVAANDVPGAVASLRAGNEKAKVIHYVATPPPGDAMSSLSRIRQLGYAKSQLTPEYVDEALMAGRRLIAAEPVTSLGVLAAASVMRNLYEVRIGMANKSNSEAARKEAARFRSWQDDLTAALKEVNVNLIDEAAREAGLTAEEAAAASRGIAPQDPAKAESFEKARKRLYDREVQTLKDAIKKLPS
jgi:hypothetical protein